MAYVAKEGLDPTSPMIMDGFESDGFTLIATVVDGIATLADWYSEHKLLMSPVDAPNAW